MALASGIILDEASRFLMEQRVGGRRTQRTAGGSEAPDVVVRIVGGTGGSIGTVGGNVERHVGHGEGGNSGGQLLACVLKLYARLGQAQFLGDDVQGGSLRH
jgi:hypothetical protein